MGKGFSLMTQYALEPKLFWPAHEKRQGEGGLRTKGYFKKSHDTKPLISVVTVVYNAHVNLEQTINSILDQNYDNIEYIIIDGGSTDGTLDIIQKYGDKIDYWVSEPDGGIYSAMNKGASLCTGDYISFINADDWYNNDTVSLVVAHIENNDVDYLFGNVDMYLQDKLQYIFKEQLAQYKFNIPFNHPSLFVKTKHLLLNPFDLKYKVIADYDFIVKLIHKQLSYIYIDESIANFRLGGISSTTNYDNEKFYLYYVHFGILRAIYNYLILIRNRFTRVCIHTARFLKRKVRRNEKK
jgi:glycosyltransferase involved in cell wall biosynthesis